MSNAWRLRLLVGLALMGGAAPGCGGDDGAECGAGTVEVDGECLPAEAACGTGTVYDATARTCVGAIECAEGTMLMGGECVPDGSVFCGGNTVFDTTSGTCVPDPDALCEGDLVFVMETATCVDPDELLEDMADVRELAEPNDPTFNDAAMAQAVDLSSGSASFYGCVEPMDFDSDGVLDADNDFFSVDVDGPTLLRVRTDGIRGANAAVAFLSGDPEGALTENGWQRLVVSLSGDGSDQKLFLPAAGTYLIVATDARSLLFGEPAGGANQCYFVQLDTETLPTPTAVTPGTPVEGDFDEPRFFSVAATRGQLLFSTVSELDGAGEPADRESTASAQVTLVQELFRSSAEETTGTVSDVAFGLEAGETVWFVVDKAYDLALDTTDFQLEVQDAGAVELPEDGTIDVTHVDETFSWGFFEATAGDVVHLTFEQGDLDGLRSVGTFQPAGNGGGICDGCSEADVYIQIAETGIHYVRWYNGDGSDGDTYPLTFTRTAITPTALTAGTAGSGTLADHDRAFFSADLRTADWIEWSAANLVNVTDLDVTLYARDAFGVLDTMVSSVDGGILTDTATLERILRDEGIQVLVSVTDDDSVDGDETFDVLLSNVSYVDLSTVMPGTDITRMGEMAPAGAEPLRYLLEGAPFTGLTFETTTAVGTLDSVIELVDTDVDPFETFDTTGAGADEGGEYLMEDDFVAFIIADASGTGGAFDLTISSTPPPYTSATGSLAFNSICPSQGGAGMLHEVDDDDDGLSVTPLAIPGDFPFEFFGAGVSEATISTNGWMTFTPSYAGDTFLDSTVFDVISPLAADVFADEVCTRRDGTTLTIEWRGYVFGFFSPDEPVEMQVVLHQNGVIDFIYGPSHESLSGEVGLVNGDGSVRYELTTLEAFPSSVTFTPAP
ncbi:MAG: hypothetical protein H6722_30365 [Sandaracinus sp.]|nr:hypothetical protein [Sandaracinus sp.]